MSVRLLASMVLGVALIGCTSGHELAVDVRTDFAPGVEVSAVRVVLDEGGDVVRDVSLDDDLSTGERVAEFSGLALGRHTLHVELRRAGRPFTSQDVSVRLDGDSILLVVLSRSCEDVTCPGRNDPESATTCFGGACVAPECLEVTREADAGSASCGPMECETSSDCEERGSCVEPSCERGACLWLPVRDRCSADEYCDPRVGACTPLPGLPRDGGMPDAGPIDAPLALEMTATSATAVALTWTTSRGADHYELELSTDASFASTTAAIATTTTHAFSMLAQGTRYYARVRGIRADGRISAWSDVATAVTAIDTPGTPSVSVTIPGATRPTAAGSWVVDPGGTTWWYAQGSASTACPAGTRAQYRFRITYTGEGPSAWTGWWDTNVGYAIQPLAGYGVAFEAQAQCVSSAARSAASGVGRGCRMRSGAGC